MTAMRNMCNVNLLVILCSRTYTQINALQSDVLCAFACGSLCAVVSCAVEPLINITILPSVNKSFARCVEVGYFEEVMRRCIETPPPPSRRLLDNSSLRDIAMVIQFSKLKGTCEPFVKFHGNSLSLIFFGFNGEVRKVYTHNQ